MYRNCKETEIVRLLLSKLNMVAEEKDGCATAKLDTACRSCLEIPACTDYCRFLQQLRRARLTCQWSSHRH